MENYQKSRAKSRVCWAIALFLALLWVLAAAVPFVFMILATFKTRFEVLANGVFSLPEIWRPDNYREVLSRSFFSYFFNSVIVLAVSLTVLLFISACASYPLSRFTFALNKPIYGAIVAAMSIPIHVTLIPIFKMTRNMGIYDSLRALFGPYIAFAVPISVFILTSFMSTIPRELEESAEIDGCGKYRTFFSVILPLSKPGLSTLAIYNGVNIWNEFVFAFTLTQSADKRTLPLATWEYQGQYSMNTPMIMSVLVLSILPMIVMFIIFQDKLVKGMMAGAVKG